MEYSAPIDILMLSEIGDPAHLAEVGIAPVHPLPGVGGDLQDRYEIGVVNRMEAALAD